MSDAALIDRIYEAAALPELWLQVLDVLRDRVGGAGASFVTGGRGPLRWVATPAMDELIQDYGRQAIANPRIAEALLRRHPGFVTDHDMFPVDVIERDAFYTDFMRPRGYGWCIGNAIFPPGVDPIIMAVEKRYDDGPVDPRHIPFFDGLRPHLARSAMVSAQLALERARATTEALGRIGLPSAVLDARHRLRAANDGFQSLVPHVASDRRERLTFTDRSADALFAEALGRHAAAEAGLARSIPLRAAHDRPPMVIHLLPVRRAAHDVFDGSSTIIAITPLSPGAAPHAQLLEGLFDLTPAEARVARMMLEGSSVEEIALVRGTSRHTVRAQLKAIFAKTATTRQAEFVRLLGATAVVHEGRDVAS